jgi:hypothetical protein
MSGRSTVKPCSSVFFRGLLVRCFSVACSSVFFRGGGTAQVAHRLRSGGIQPGDCRDPIV